MRVIVLLLLALGCGPACTAAAEDWPMLQHDPQRTGRSKVSVVVGNRARWVWVDEQTVTRDFDSKVGNSIQYARPRNVILAGDVQPIVAENKVFFGAVNGEFHALDGETGRTVWKRTLGGAVVHTAAYAEQTVVTGCLDGNLYGLAAADGGVRWAFKAEAGFSTAPLLQDGVAYATSRDGHLYAVDLKSGKLVWKYRNLAETPEHPFSGAPIFQSPASDGKLIFFGAENMYFYAVDAQSGKEAWRRPLGGSSFMFTWPVVHQGLVMTYVMVPCGLSEYVLEKEFDALPNREKAESPLDFARRVWPQERTVIREWLRKNPHYRNFYVMKATDGKDAFAEDVPMGRVGGFGYPGRAPVVDGKDRILTYWRTKSATFLSGTGTFGTKYVPDVGILDPKSGDRVFLEKPSPPNMCELDNNYLLTVGGDWLYGNNHMRGAKMMNLNGGPSVTISAILANWDGGNFRGWGVKLIWFSNEKDGKFHPFPSIHASPQGESGVVPALVKGKPMLFFQESGHYQINFGCLSAVEGNP